MRRMLRRWSGLRLLTKINLVVGTAILLAFAYLGTTVYFGAASQVRYDSNDFPGAQKAATTFLALSPLERHIGYYNRGTAKAAVGDFEPAQEDLETALEITPPRDECAVRINLSYVYEKLADQVAGQDEKKSGELYDQALATLDDAPEECRPDKSETQQKSDEAKQRVEDKKQGGKSQNSGSGDDSQGSDSSQNDDQQSGDDSQGSNDQGSNDNSDTGDENTDDGAGQTEQEKKREELKQRGEDSNREQQQQGPGGNGGRTTPDKPW